ncbi:MAG TPA: glycosyl hydrolase family 79 C-terminal domain-containing protein [Pirellulales bacterium]|jgi:hypothetical protein|nr:glycosyl hydrolase family 79 C-terminal domain-containing protein [Pirellulales bacterium]
MDRRRFLIHSTSAAIGAAGFRSCFAQSADSSAKQPLPEGSGASQSEANAPVAAELVVDLQSPSHLIPLTYNGLSYELAQLSNPNFFSGANKELIALFRLLSPQGILRLGGNSSEFCWFKADASTLAPGIVPAGGPVAENWMPNKLFQINPEAVDRLAGFLHASGWQVIYGLNLGHSSPERAVKEAEYVAHAVGDKLLYFQIGNEPDFYHNANNKTRPPNWSFADYLTEWTAFADAVTARVPDARFGGPDVGSSSNWINQFLAGAAKNLGSRLMAVTGHYYAEGPPDDPKVTTKRLLHTDSNIAKRTQLIAEAAAKDHVVYRMTEGNSCYRGGKPGMSDAFASALWAGDYMLALATAGCAGVNLHGGSREFLRASLGDHMPGELVSKAGSAAKGGYYTPIDGEVASGFSARPIFYGMFLANQLAGGNTHAVTLNGLDGANVTAYAVEKDGKLRIAVFNKDETRNVQLALRGIPSQQATVWRLVAPALDSTSDVTLCGSGMSAAGWTPSAPENLSSAAAEGLSLNLPHASAALILLEA